MGYIERARPRSIAQIARALDMDRAHLYRILHAAYGPNFREKMNLVTL